MFYLDHSWAGKWVDQAEKICKNEEVGKAGDFGKSMDALVIYAFCQSKSELDYGQAALLFENYGKRGKYFGEQNKAWIELFANHVDYYGFAFFYWHKSYQKAPLVIRVNDSKSDMFKNALKYCYLA